jgi:hypothetical protein
MTDRELLEAAAKAARLEYRDDLWDGGHARNADGLWVAWRPLTDDGDALRLFCRMPFCELWVSEIGVSVFLPRKPGAVGLKCGEYANEHGGDLQAAMRHAIVRAAAEIGAAK